LKGKNVLLAVASCLGIALLTAQGLPPLPVSSYDYHITANNVSPISLGMGGINLTNAADYFLSYDNPALLAGNDGTALATSFLLKNPGDMNFAEVMKVSNLLDDKQFMYYTLIAKNSAWSYQPVTSTHVSEIYGSTSEYYDYKLDKLQMSLAAKDEKYSKLSGGISIKYLSGRLIYLKERISGTSMIREAFIDNKVKGFSTDLGLTWEEDKFTWGACFYDLFSYLWWEDYDSKQLQRRAAMGFQYNMENLALTGSVLGKISSSPATTYHLGLIKNWTWNNGSTTTGRTTEQNLIVRAGLFSNDFNGTENINYTLGSGYNYNMFRVDFAMTNTGMRLSESQYLFSVGVGIQ
jgi:hypothetical protein